MQKFHPNPRERIIFALDNERFLANNHARLKPLLPHIGMVKLGYDIIYAECEDGSSQLFKTVDFLHNHDTPILIDAKLHDKPKTIEKAVRHIATLGVDGFTIHASTGDESLRVAKACAYGMTVCGVTLLTSIGKDECEDMYTGVGPEAQVAYFAKKLINCGITTIICSAFDNLAALRKIDKTKQLTILTPGIRLERRNDDQARWAHPKAAIRAGADKLIVGSEIHTPAPEFCYIDAAKNIASEIEKGLKIRGM